MNRSAFPQSILLATLFLGALHAIEIPVKDLTQDSSQNATPPIPRAIPVTPQKASPPPSAPTSPPSAVKLELALREIQLLRKAAQKAGGDLEITLRPTGGITAADLILPLAQSGAFEIKPGQAPGSIRVQSKLPSDSLPTAKPLREPSTPPSLSPKSEPIPTLILK